MRKFMLDASIGAALLMGFVTGANAANCPAYAYVFSNGTTADAIQVNGNFDTILNCANNNLAPITSPSFTGNVGIGVTPSAWVSYQKGVDFGGAGNYGGLTSRGGWVELSNNAYINSSVHDTYKNTGVAEKLVLVNGGYEFLEAVSGSAGATITWKNVMTMDSSGHVGIGTPSPMTALAVVGDIRVGTSGTNGCIQNFSGTALAGTCSSDARLKTVLHSVSHVLDGFARLELVAFKWNDTAAAIYRNSKRPTNTGFTAQSVEKVFPELVSTDPHGYKQINYTNLQLYGLEAIKELKIANDRQAQEIALLKRKVSLLEHRMGIKTAAAIGEHVGAVQAVDVSSMGSQ